MINFRNSQLSFFCLIKRTKKDNQIPYKKLHKYAAEAYPFNNQQIILKIGQSTVP